MNTMTIFIAIMGRSRLWDCKPQPAAPPPPPPPPPTGFFATQILGGNVTSRNQGPSSNDQGKQRRETLGTRLFTSMDCPNEESDDVNTESLEIL